MSRSPEPAQGPVPSPCVNICRLDEQRRWCTGCWRSLDEIAGWASMDDERKRQVWQQLPLRRSASESSK